MKSSASSNLNLLSVFLIAFLLVLTVLSPAEPPYWISGHVRTPEGAGIHRVWVGFTYVGQPFEGWTSCYSGTDGRYGTIGEGAEGYLPFMPGQYDIRIVPQKDGYEFAPEYYLIPRTSQSWADIVRNFQGVPMGTHYSGSVEYGSVDIGKMKYGYIDVPEGAAQFTIVYNIIGNAVVVPNYNTWPTPPGGSDGLRLAASSSQGIPRVRSDGTTQSITIDANSTPPIQPGKWYIGVYGNEPSTYSLRTLLVGPGPAPTISGTVYANDGVTPLTGATISGTNSAGSATSAADGTYQLTVPHFWTGELTVTKGPGRFDPYPRDYALLEDDQDNQDFQGPLYELTITTERGAPRGEGWYPEGSLAEWSVTSPEIEAPGIRHVPSQSGGEVLMDGPKDIQVGWVKQYRLATWASPAGRGAIQPVTGWILAGSTVQISSAAADGSSFLHYSGDLTGPTTPRTLLMDGPKNVTARFHTSPLPDPEPGIRKVPLEFSTIQAAIDAAEEGDTVIVDPGIYNEVIAFNGKNITLQSIDPENWAIVESTIIDGTTTSLASVVTFRGDETPDCVLAGFTITGGEAYWGAGILGNPDWESEEGTKATIRRCIVRNNHAFYKSTWPYMGGFSGGILNCDGLIEECIVRDNTTGRYGGGIHGCDGEIVRTIVSGNQGGGIHESNARIDGCEIFENIGVGINICNHIIENSIIHSNQGAGIQGCTNAFIRNCVIHSNIAQQGAGINGNNNEVINCTIYNNTNTSTGASGTGAGLKSCTGVVKNNIVWGNHGSTYGGWPEWNKQIWTSNYWEFKAEYSCIQDIPTTDTGNIFTDPQFVNRAAFDMRLLETSHCIDAGAEVDLDRDINGVPRPMEGFALGSRGDGSHFDMGAYEYAVLELPGQPVMHTIPEFSLGDTNTVAWTTVDHAARYEVQCDDDEDFSSPYAVRIVSSSQQNPASLSATFDNLADATYWYRVRGVNAVGEPGPWSESVHARQDCSAPWFFNIQSDPDIARRGEWVTLSFIASEPLAYDPLVSVNGMDAWVLDQAGLHYIYRCRVPLDASGGPAQISIEGYDLVGFNGTTINHSALTIDTSNAAADWEAYD